MKKWYYTAGVEYEYFCNFKATKNKYNWEFYIQASWLIDRKKTLKRYFS